MQFKTIGADKLEVSGDLRRTSRSKVFQEHLVASIREIGLAEPLKVARKPGGGFVVIDGVLRLEAINAIRRSEPDRFNSVPCYIFKHDQRLEIRFQSDIYQDLLPSQLATLVEHLHSVESIRKQDIARYIGVSTATLRNYTGLWRMLQRKGLFARVVELMDAGVIPASNPFAWLRLTAAGLRHVIVTSFSEGQDPNRWVDEKIVSARAGMAIRYSIQMVESATGDLTPEFYREAQVLRDLKRNLGRRRHEGTSKSKRQVDGGAVRNLVRVERSSVEPVLVAAARSLREYVS
jgi:hypothetical protein